jgi:hypothetical protein
MEEYGKRPPPNKGEEYIVVNSGRREVTDVEVGGRHIHLASAGATLYDKSLALEVKAKYKNDPNVSVIEKPYVSLNDGHRTHFTVPLLPWKDKGNGEEESARKQVDLGGYQEAGGPPPSAGGSAGAEHPGGEVGEGG